jgi:hypothetical protein
MSEQAPSFREFRGRILFKLSFEFGELRGQGGDFLAQGRHFGLQYRDLAALRSRSHITDRLHLR